MSATAYARLGRVSDRRALTAYAGRGALVTSAFAAWWLAGAAAGSTYLIHLPGNADAAWIAGPLRGILTAGPSGVSIALLVLIASYLGAIAFAAAISVRAAVAAVIVATGAFVLAPTIVSSDVFGYIAYAREAAAHGLNPYLAPPRLGVGDPVLPYLFWRNATSPYGPFFTLLSMPLGLVPVGVALWAYKLLAGLASVALTIVVVRIARARGLDPARAAVVVGLNPVLLFYAVGGAHNDLLATALVVCGLALVVAGRERVGAGVAVAGAAIKLTLGLAVPFVVLAAARRRAALTGSGVAAIGIAAVSVVLFGPHLFDQLHRIASEPRFDIAFSGPDRLASLLGTPITSALRVLCTAGALTTAAVMIVLAARGRDPLLAAGWALLALIAAIASLAPWYLVWLLPVAALVPNRRLSVATVLATVYLLAVHLPIFGGHPWLSGPSHNSRAIIAASSSGASVRLTSSPSARPETMIAPTMSAASASAHRRVYQPRIRATPPTSSSTPTTMTNTSGAGRP